MAENPKIPKNFDPSQKGKATVLSTKKLSVGQRELLLNSGIGLVEKDFISIVPLPFEVTTVPKNLIFTSKNAVKAILGHPLKRQFQEGNIFCVGEKTSELLRKEGFQVLKTANYGKELASAIIEDHAGESFLFFCGKKRNDDLPLGLREAGVKFREIEVYDTVATPTKIDRIFDGVLFFSPSAVKSFCSKNDLFGSLAFCIGTTTSAEAEKHTQEIITATTPSIENVIVQVVKYFKTKQAF